MRSIVPVYSSTCTRALTFENVCHALQAASDRAQEHLLDLRVHVFFEAINLSMLAKRDPRGDETPEAIARLDITNVDAHMSVWRHPFSKVLLICLYAVNLPGH